MIDFSSALYLGLHHPALSLRPWDALSTGKPAALANPEGSGQTAQALATLIGCERGILLPSTLHAFWDLFAILSDMGPPIYMDSGVYPVARWGIEHASARGCRVQEFPHHKADALHSLLKRNASSGFRPAVVTDGYCPGCGKPAPVMAYLECVRAYGGYLIMDDTQSMGIFGERSKPDTPYGRGGGGMLKWSGMRGDDIVIVSSLAKGLGVPVAVLTGSEAFVEYFKHRSETRLHCSPPSVAVIRAAEHALEVNKKCGDSLRMRLARLVAYFRRRLAETGLRTAGGIFPVQTLAPASGPDALRLHEYLMHSGISTVLHKPKDRQGARISFLITASHDYRDIDCTIDALSCGMLGQSVNQ